MPNYRMVKTRTRAPRRRVARRGKGRRGGKIHWGKVWGSVKRFGKKANKFLKKGVGLTCPVVLVDAVFGSLDVEKKSTGRGG